MKIEKQFAVAADPATVWAELRQVEVVVPLLPGAELTEVVDEENYKGKIDFKVGPKVVTFLGSAQFQRFDADLRGVLNARGGDLRRASKAAAVIEFTVGEGASPQASLVVVDGDIKFFGGLAQFAEEGGVYVGEAMLTEFGERLVAHMREVTGGEEDQEQPSAARQTAVNVRFSVLVKVFFKQCLSWVRGLFGRR